MRIKKYLSPAGALNKRYTDKDFEGTGWHYIPRSDIKPDDKLLNTALKLGEEYYLAGEDGYLLPSNTVNDFLKNKDLNNYFTLQYDANDRIGQLMKLRAADRKANQLTPGAGTFVVAPVAATLAPILGYEAIAAAPALYSWLTGTTAGQGLVASTLGGEAVEGLSRLAGYNGFGDMMTKNAGCGTEFGWSFANPGYYLSPSRAAVGTASRVAADALGNVKIANPLMESLKATMGDYSRKMLGIDSEMTKAAIDATVNATRKKAINTAARASFYFPQKDAATKTSQLWRNQEYNNFLNVVNGNNYYELVESTAERPKIYHPNNEYFISHTTPWAEFTDTRFIPSWTETEEEVAGSYIDPAYFVNGKNKLYEFPHKTFGDLKATGAKPGEYKQIFDESVRDLGRLHLHYGRTASGPRGEVPTMGNHRNTYRQGWGLTERPLKKPLAYPEGIYDYNPIYEDIFHGPQTIVTGDELTNALLHSNYNIYERTPNGVQRTVFLGEPEMQLSHKDLIGSNRKGGRLIPRKYK